MFGLYVFCKRVLTIMFKSLHAQTVNLWGANTGKGSPLFQQMCEEIVMFDCDVWKKKTVPLRTMSYKQVKWFSFTWW